MGAVTPPQGYLQSIAEICQQHGVLLIADEVMTGMGRTGRNFACEHWQIAPDILVTAKGLSSGYAPLGAVIASKKVIDAIAAGSGAFLHGFTYNAHPVSLAAGRAVLQRMKLQNLVHAADSQTNGTAGSMLKIALDGPARSRCGWRCPRSGVAEWSRVRRRQENQGNLFRLKRILPDI